MTMDYLKYNSLNLEERTRLWRSLLAHPAYQVLMDKYLLRRPSLPTVEGVDSEKAFLAAAIREKAIREVLEMPQHEIFDCELVMGSQKREDRV